MPERAATEAAALRVEQVSVERGRVPVLRDIDLEHDRGQVLAILGPNGAGKTTLLKAAVGLLPIAAGRIALFGKPLEAHSPRARARQLAFVPQQTLLRAGLPVRDVVAQGRFPHRGGFYRPSGEDLRLVEDAMVRADVARFSERAFTDLSFGEQRRVLLARGLCTGAPILCLDEPTASLDIAHALSLHHLLRELAREGRCIVVVMHDLDDALLHTDRALLMNRGRVVACGDTATVLTPETIEDVYGVRMRTRAGLRFELVPSAETGS